MRKPSIKKAYNEMNAAASNVFVTERGMDVTEMNGIDDYLYCMEMSEGIDECRLMEAANELFHSIGVLSEERNLALDEEIEYCAVHRNEYSGKYFVLFNHPVVMGRGDCGDTVKVFGEAQRKAIAEEESNDDVDNGKDVEANGDSKDFDEWEAGEKRIKQIGSSSHGKARPKRLDCSREDAAIEEAKRRCGIDDDDFNGINLYCYNIMLPLEVGDEKAAEFANCVFHAVGVLDADCDVGIGEGTDFCELVRDDEMECYCVIFNHHLVVEDDDLYEYSVAALREGDGEEKDEE